MNITYLSAIRARLGLLASVVLVALSGCSEFQKDIVVPLPEYAAELVVECYLEDGVRPRLTVTESVSYLSAVTPVVPTDVTVTLTMPNGQQVRLPFRPGLDTLREKLHTHIGTAPLVARPGDTFRLEVRDTKGRRVTGTATVKAPVPIDSIEYQFNNRPVPDRRAYLTVMFRDPVTPADFYRVLIHKGGSIYKAPQTDRLLEDPLFNGQVFPVGTGYDFHPGDTITATLYHIDEPYYRFRRSSRDARNANGNPFAQPSAVFSTVQGGIGVFTVLSYTRRRIVLP